LPGDKRLFIGSDFGTTEGSVAFLSNRNFHESNLIVWCPFSVISEMNSHGHPYPLGTMKALERRLTHLTEWLLDGNALVLLSHQPASFWYQDPPDTHPSSLDWLSPLDGIDFKLAAGTRVEYCGPPSAFDLFADHLQFLQYDVLLSGADLIPLLRVALGSPGATQIVGGYRRYGAGLIAYLPPCRGNPAQVTAYINSISKIADALGSQPSELPNWVDQYQTESDIKAFTQIAELTRQAADLQSQLEVQQDQIQSSRSLKRLIYDSGSTFAGAVAASLIELGLPVVEGPHPRADLLSSNGVRFAAIEANGIEGATKEKDVRQTVQWMAEVDSALATADGDVDPDLSRYIDQLAKLEVNRDGSDCKGFLVMGTFRKTPLSERIQPSFPEPVKRVLERADICAFTGLQLLGLVLESRKDPSLKPTITKELFETRGVLQRALEWNEFLTLAGDDS
jgi:hypothetical protein